MFLFDFALSAGRWPPTTQSNDNVMTWYITIFQSLSYGDETDGNDYLIYLRYDPPVR